MPKLIIYSLLLGFGHTHIGFDFGYTNNGGPDKWAQCVFPFEFGGKVYNGCTLDGADDGCPWCSTLTDFSGAHVGGQGNWGTCHSTCNLYIGYHNFVRYISIPSLPSAQLSGFRYIPIPSLPSAQFSGIGVQPRTLEAITIDEEIAPNSYSAEIVRHTSFSNDLLRDNSKKFDTLAPTFVFRGYNPNAYEVVKWEELKRYQQAFGDLNKFVEKLHNELNFAEKLVIITHGFKDGNIQDCENQWGSDLVYKIGILQNDEELGLPKTATIAVCWNSHPFQTNFPLLSTKRLGEGKLCYASYQKKNIYYTNAASTGKVGELLASLITSIQRVYSNIKYVHGIGHSLGAHVMGNIFNFGLVKIDRITGLDPAGPCFERDSKDIHIQDFMWGLHKGAAFLVDNIHTDAGYYGTKLSKGDIDLFTGNPDKSQSGAGLQPTCRTCAFGCCHGLSIQYFLRSITNSEKTTFQTAYITKSQNNDNNDATSIGPVVRQQTLFAGYHLDPAVYDGRTRFQGRMFLPVFEVNGNWYPICDLQNLPSKDHKWCIAVI